MAPVHANEGNRTIAAECGGMTECHLEKLNEGFGRHLAGRHCEFAMSDPAKPAYVSIDRHIIRRVCEDEVCTLAVQDMCEGPNFRRVATQESMPTEEP